MTVKNILYMDCWSDHNRGDAAMQIGMIRLARRFAPKAHITVMGAYGYNQYPDFVGQMDETSSLADATVGGFRPTFVPFDMASRFGNSRARKLRTLVSLVTLPALLVYLTAVRWVPALLVLAPKSLRKSVRAVREAEIILWNGRNFRSDSKVREPYEIGQLLFNPLIARIYGKPIAAVGISIWPLKSRPAKKMLAWSLNNCFFISARESNSYKQAVESLGIDTSKVHLLPDLSLAAIVPNGSIPERIFDRALPTRYALTVVDWPNNGAAVRDNYVSALKTFVKARLAENSATTFTLIPQVTYEMESTSAIFAELSELDPNRVSVASDVMTVDSLVTEYSKYDFLIATRMHSAIFATCSLTPLVTIPYDAGGKWAILDMMGQVDVAIPYRDLTVSQLDAQIEEVWERRHATAERVRNRLPELVDRVADNVRIPLENLP